MEFLTLDRDRLPLLTPLWQAAFGDTEAQIARFLELVPSRSCFLTGKHGPVATVTVIPQTVVTRDRRFPAAYLYALTTAADLRGQGLATELLSRTEDLLRREGCCGILISPASASLSRWYETLGFRPWGPEQTLPLRQPEGPPVTAEQYVSLRQAWLGDIPHNDLSASVLTPFLLTGSGAWEDGRPVEDLTGPPHSPGPMLYKDFSGDFPGAGYFSFTWG